MLVIRHMYLQDEILEVSRLERERWISLARESRRERDLSREHFDERMTQNAGSRTRRPPFND